MKMEFLPKPNIAEEKKEDHNVLDLKDVVAAAAMVVSSAGLSASAQETVVMTENSNTSQEIVQDNRTINEKITTNEKEKYGEFFSLEQYTYNTLYYRLTNRQVIFTDEKGIVIGGPVNLEPIRVDNQIIMPGNLDSRGVPVSNISQAWLNAARLRQCNQYLVPCDLENSRPRVRSTIRLVRDAEKFFTPGSERPETFFDIIEHMGSRSVEGESEPISYIEYAHNNLGKNTQLPVSLQNEISSLGVGLIAQESQYNDAAQSPVGARGMLQIMPDTQKRMGYGTNRLSFQKQIELSSKYFENAYTELTTSNEDDFEYLTREFFGGDKEAFEKYFLAPVMINSYNAGVGRLSRVISWFVANKPTKESLQIYTNGEENFRYDVFAVMAHLASENTTPETSGYKEHSSEYFSRVFSLSEIINAHINSKSTN